MLRPEGSRNCPVAYRHDDMPEEDHDHETQEKPRHRDVPRSRVLLWICAGVGRQSCPEACMHSTRKERLKECTAFGARMAK